MSALQWVSLAVGIVTILAALIKVVAVVSRLNREFCKMRDSYRGMRATNGLLLEASFVILDGLKQQGCNGRVTEMHNRLLRYVTNKKEG